MAIRTLHPAIAKYIFFYVCMGYLEKLSVKNDWGHKTKLNQFQNISSIQNLIPHYIAMKLGTNSKKMTGKSSSGWKLRNLILNTHFLSKEIPVNIRKYFDLTKNKLHIKICEVPLKPYFRHV